MKAELWCEPCKMAFRDDELAYCPFCNNRKPEILVRYVN